MGSSNSKGTMVGCCASGNRVVKDVWQWLGIGLDMIKGDGGNGEGRSICSEGGVWLTGTRTSSSSASRRQQQHRLFGLQTRSGVGLQQTEGAVEAAGFRRRGALQDSRG